MAGALGASTAFAPAPASAENARAVCNDALAVTSAAQRYHQDSDFRTWDFSKLATGYTEYERCFALARTDHDAEAGIHATVGMSLASFYFSCREKAFMLWAAQNSELSVRERKAQFETHRGDALMAARQALEWASLAAEIEDEEFSDRQAQSQMRNFRQSIYAYKQGLLSLTYDGALRELANATRARPAERSHMVTPPPNVGTLAPAEAPTADPIAAPTEAPAEGPTPSQ